MLYEVITLKIENIDPKNGQYGVISKALDWKLKSVLKDRKIGSGHKAQKNQLQNSIEIRNNFV